jgi:hypothetical protein
MALNVLTKHLQTKFESKFSQCWGTHVMMLENAGLRAAREAERGGLQSAMVPLNIARKLDWGAVEVKGMYQ